MKVAKLKKLYQRLDLVTFLRLVLFDLSRRLFLPQARYFFAQGGEDIHILYLLNDPPTGYYLDIGSNDPIQYSNSFKLYLAGWTGLLVDGNPVFISRAKKIRALDTCVHALVSNENRKMDFYIADGDLYSSIDSAHASMGADNRPLHKIEMETQTLDQLIARYVPASQVIDLLSIDVEGHDLPVLRSISLEKYRPRIIVIEDLFQVKLRLPENEYVKYFLPFRYMLVSTDKQNLYFMREEDLT